MIRTKSTIVPKGTRLPAAQQEQNIQHEPLVDVTAAFEYYLQNYNHGRPFILAGTPGTMVLLVRFASGLWTAYKVGTRADGFAAMTFGDPYQKYHRPQRHQTAGGAAGAEHPA